MTPFNKFDAATLRLKQALKVTMDKEAAALLGLRPVAWANRKKRGSFPDKEVYALAAQRPELGLNPEWIVSGEGESRHEVGGCDGTTASLLHTFRKLSDMDQVRLINIARQWAGGKP